MLDQPVIRLLTINDLPQCEEFFSPPIAVTYRRQILRQSSSTYSLYGYFVDKQLQALMHISRQGPKDDELRTAYPYPLLGNLVVRPEYRRQGISRKLLRHAEAVLRLDNWPAVGLIVSTENHHAIEIYEKAGYKPVQQLSPRPDYDIHPRVFYLKYL